MHTPVRTPDYASPGTSTPRPTFEGSKGQRQFVRLAIALAAALVIGMVALLYYRWVVAKEPNAELVIVGTSDYEGAVITVSGTELDKPYESTITAEDGHQAPFFLNRGLYSIRIEQGGEVLYDHSFAISPRTRLTLKLEDLDVPTTRQHRPSATSVGTPLPPRGSQRP